MDKKLGWIEGLESRVRGGPWEIYQRALSMEVITFRA